MSKLTYSFLKNRADLKPLYVVSLIKQSLKKDDLEGCFFATFKNIENVEDVLCFEVVKKLPSFPYVLDVFKLEKNEIDDFLTRFNDLNDDDDVENCLIGFASNNLISFISEEIEL